VYPSGTLKKDSKSFTKISLLGFRWELC